MQQLKTIIIDIAPPWLSEAELDHRMDELESLVSTYGGVTIVKRVQKRTSPDYRTFIGSGKLDEIIAEWWELWAELLIIWNIMKPAQVWNVNEHIRKSKSKMQAWDRIDLILKIFALHAVSPESKLQIELAAIKHMWPRIYGMGMELSRQWGGSKNAKWQGETNTEIMKRHLKEKEFIILKKLESYGRTRALQRESRKRKWFVTVGIVGYTNAWKSSLFNTLTKKWVLAEDKLFATLGTSVWKVWINLHEENTDSSTYKAEWFELLINDTIGFIRDLPPELISAFTSTLEDSVESDLLLHVIDSNDEWIDEKISIVDATLESIEATQPRLYIFNKIDGLDKKKRKVLEKKYRELSPVFVSAMTAEGIDVLKERLKDHFWK